MKRTFLIILLSLISQVVAFSVDKQSILENITISNLNKFSRITLIFNKQFEFLSSKKGEIIEIKLPNTLFSENFPGASFYLKTGCIKSLDFEKEGATKITIKITTTNVNDYNIFAYKDSKSLIIDVYNPLDLSTADLKFRNALRLNAEGQQEAALREFRKLASENYSNPEMYFYAGLIRESLGYLYQAKSNLSDAKNMGVEYPDLFSRLADIYEKVDQKENSIIEKKRFNVEYDKLRKTVLDSSLVIVSKSIKSFIQKDTSNLAQTLTDSLNSLNSAKNNQIKPNETRIVKSEPLKNDSYWYALISNIVVILVAGACIFSLWLVVRKKSVKKIKKNKNDKKDSKNSKSSKNIEKEKPVFEGVNLLNNEIANPNPYKKTNFSEFINEYKKNDPGGIPVKEVKEKPIGESKEKSPVERKNGEMFDIVDAKKPEIQTNDIEKLAKKYRVEQDKVELALKLMSKNEPVSKDDKYRVLNEMLKQNKSIEELAKQLRIPKGEIDLISSLNEL